MWRATSRELTERPATPRKREKGMEGVSGVGRVVGGEDEGGGESSEGGFEGWKEKEQREPLTGA